MPLARVNATGFFFAPVAPQQCGKALFLGPSADTLPEIVHQVVLFILDVHVSPPLFFVLRPLELFELSETEKFLYHFRLLPLSLILFSTCVDAAR